LPAGPWLDLGTGAGFPGLVVAALQPERHVTLVDSRAAPNGWNAPAALDLANVEVILARVEDVPARIASVICPRVCAARQAAASFCALFHTRHALAVAQRGQGEA
jgi:16S rRNA (guanine527-N7)-methyltransferase